MTLEPVIEEITRKGHLEIAEIRREAEKKAEEIIAEAKEKAEEIIKKAKAEAEREVERLRKQEISGIKLEMKKEELAKKKDVVERVREKLIEKIRNMGESEREELLKKLISKYDQDGFKVYSSKKDEEIVKKLVKKMEYAGNIECLGGIILESADGSYRINLTFDNIVEEVFEDKMKDIHKILFGE